jgi:hypothetical protein
MKVRQGFVSNSSSSSFVCDISGEEVSGMDMGLREAGMYECENGHTFLEEYLIGDPWNETTKEEFLKIEKDRNENPGQYIKNRLQEVEEMTEEEWQKNADDIFYDFEWSYELPAKYCPICQMEEFVSSDLKKYLIRETGITEGEVFKEVKEKNKRRRKLYNNEYFNYVLNKHPEKTKENLSEEIKNRFKTYEEFYEYTLG